jgi:hypothetical protein
MLEVSNDILHGRAAVIGAVIDAAGPGAMVLFYQGPRPSLGADPVEQALVAVTLELPCGVMMQPDQSFPAVPAPAWVLSLKAGEGQVVTSGRVAWARVVDGAGKEHLRCDVDEEGAESGAPFVVDKSNVYAGGYMRLTAAYLW